MFSSFLWQPLLGHNWYNDSHTYSHRKLFLYAKRYVFSYVDLFSHYTGSSFQPVTLKLECSFIVVQLFCIWYTLTYHMFSTTSCRFLSKSRMTSSLKLKHVLYHSTSPCSLLYASLHWLDHSWVLAYCPISTLLAIIIHDDTHNILPPLLTSTKANKAHNWVIPFPN